MKDPQGNLQNNIVSGMLFKQDFDIEEIASRGSDTPIEGELIMLVYQLNRSHDLRYIARLNTDTYELVKYDVASDTYSLKTITNLYLLPEELLPTSTISNVHFQNVVPQKIYNIHIEKFPAKQDGSIGGKGGKKVRAGDEIALIVGAFKDLQKQEWQVTYHLTSHRWYVSAEEQKKELPPRIR